MGELDRRREPRRYVDLRVDCDADGTFLFARSDNISSLGMFLRAPVPLTVGTTITLTIPIPDRADTGRWSDTGPLYLIGKVVWTTESREGLDPGMGVEFLDPTREERGRLMSLIETIATIGAA